MQALFHGIGLEVLEPLELFNENYKESNLYDVGEAKNQ